jgi:hypothetical protein
MSDGCVAKRFKMLTYYRVRSAFKALHALPSNMIWAFQATSFYLIETGLSVFSSED